MSNNKLSTKSSATEYIQYLAAQIKRFITPFTIILVTACFILPFLYIGRFNYPSSDDFVYSAWTNILNTQSYQYHNWSGRYFSILLGTISPLHWHSIPAYRAVAYIIILLFSIVNFLFVFKVLTAYTKASRRLSTFMAAVTLVLLLSNYNAVFEGFYWYTGATTYTLSEILFISFLCLAVHLDRNVVGRISVGHYIFGFLLIGTAIGNNEMIMILCDILCISLYLYYRRHGRLAMARYYLFLTIICVLCSCISLLAPGNMVRQATLSRSSQTAITTWLYFSATIAREWILDPFLLLYSALFLYFSKRLGFPVISGRLLTAFLLPVCIIFLLAFPNLWIMGTPPPGRIRNLIYVFFVFAWLYFLLKLSAHLHLLLEGQSPAKHAARQIVKVVVILALIRSFNMNSFRNSNYFIIAKSLSLHIPQNYSKDMAQRYALIQNSTSDIVVVPPIPKEHRPGSLLYYTDIGPNPFAFPNPAFAAYWGRSQIYTLQDTLIITPKSIH